MALLFIIWLGAGGLSHATGYMAVVDAGSSGTRLYLYEYSDDPPISEPSLIFQYATQKSKGLSFYVADPAQAGPQELGPLLSGLNDFLVANDIDPGSVVISVLATAGMRLVQPDRAKRIYASVRQEIARRGYWIKHLATMTGQDEGLYAWVDVNWLLGNLGSAKQTVGIIEVGGASAQVALAVDPISRFGDAVTVIRVGAQQYHVLSVSYLGLGINEARRSMLQLLAQINDQPNPCYPNSDSADVRYKPFGASDANALVNVQGLRATFGPGCFAAYAQVLGKAKAAANIDFPVDRFHSMANFYERQFILLSSFYTKTEASHLISGRPADKTLLADIIRLCGGRNAWSSLIGRYGTGPFAQNFCANAAYMYSLIFSGHGLALSTSRVQASGEINGQRLNWTRGYVLLSRGS
jgi:hypothetical protein